VLAFCGQKKCFEHYDKLYGVLAIEPDYQMQIFDLLTRAFVERILEVALDSR